jgi:arsenite methyltransferase
MNTTDTDDIRSAVRETYGRIAEQGTSCCGSGGGCSTSAVAGTDAERLGYSAEDANAVPDGANLGLGCGNPQAIAALVPGETVLDLGSGAGFDAFLAARAVGASGRVIGVDMTHEMLAKARNNAVKAGYANVEFRLGEIEHLPVADASVDVIISNCVINLSPDKQQVFREAFRVLRPGGRLAISDVVATAELPESVRRDLALYTGCMAGASPIDELEAMLHAAGFADIRIQPKDISRDFTSDWAPGRRVEEYVVSATIEAIRPASPATQPAMEGRPPLHAAILAPVSLSAAVAVRHPDMGLCQVMRLRDMGVPPHQIASVVEIAGHLRDEAAQRVDAAFDERLATIGVRESLSQIQDEAKAAEGACCSSRSGTQACC